MLRADPPVGAAMRPTTKGRPDVTDSQTPLLQFTPPVLIGHISSVDLSHVYVIVDNHTLLNRISVGKLVAIESQQPGEFYIGIAERITRRNREGQRNDGDSDTNAGAAKNVMVQVLLIGLYCTQGPNGRANVFKRGTSTFPQIDRQAWLVEEGNLQQLMGLLANQFDAASRLKLGQYLIDGSAPAIADGNRFFQRHAAILGSTGSGKSWSVALMLERANALKFANMIVFDLHGEYEPLSRTKGGFARRFRIAGPGDLDVRNEDVLYLPYWVFTPEELLSFLRDESDPEAPYQASRFTSHIGALKEKTLNANDNTDMKKTFSVSSPIPYSLKELMKGLNDEDLQGKLTRFINRFNALAEDRLYGFIFRPPFAVLEYRWLADQMVRLLGATDEEPGIKIIDFSEVPNEVLPVVVGVFARLLYDIQFWIDARKRTPITIVCDEAHLYLSPRHSSGRMEQLSLRSFERVAKEGRKYGVSLLIVTQRPSDISTTILSQCNNFLILRLTNDEDQKVVRRLLPDHMAGLSEILPMLDVGEALILGDSVILPSRVVLDQPRCKPRSATLDFWSQWNSAPPDAGAIGEAVETLRRHRRTTDNTPENQWSQYLGTTSE